MECLGRYAFFVMTSVILSGCAPATVRAQFLLISRTAPGGPKSTPFWSKIKAKWPPEASRWRIKSYPKRLRFGGQFLDLTFMNFQAPGGGPEGFKWHLKSCSLLLVSGVLLARARGSKIDPILVQNRGQKPPRSRPDGFESCLQYGCDFSFFLFEFLIPRGGA